MSEQIREKEEKEIKLREAIAKICFEKISGMDSGDRSTIDGHLLAGELLISEKRQSLHIASSRVDSGAKNPESAGHRFKNES